MLFMEWSGFVLNVNMTGKLARTEGAMEKARKCAWIFCLTMTSLQLFSWSLVARCCSHTCKTVPNTTPCFWNRPSGSKEGKEDVGGRVGRSRKGMSHSYGPVSVCKTSNLYNRLTFTVRNCPSALKQHVKITKCVCSNIQTVNSIDYWELHDLIPTWLGGDQNMWNFILLIRW